MSDLTRFLPRTQRVAIDIKGSPLYREDTAELERAIKTIAARTVAASSVALESITIAFRNDDDAVKKQRTFVFLVKGKQAVLQPLLNDEAAGPLTVAEIKALFVDMDAPTSPEREKCLIREIEQHAEAAGDPQTLDPAIVDFLPVDEWQRADNFGKRLVLAQVIATKAAFECSR